MSKKGKIITILGATVATAGAGLGTYFFKYAFVRHKKDDAIIIDDNHHPCNVNSLPYLEEIEEGQKYIDEKAEKWVETKSYDDLKLMARWYPAGRANDTFEASDKTIILFHGYRSTARRDFSVAVNTYNSLGLNVLLVDQRAHGRSEGKLITFGINERHDVISWVNYVKMVYPDHDILLGGISMGAATVLMASELLDKETIKCIIADCGYTSPKEIMCKVCKEVFHTKGEPWFMVLNQACKKAGFDLSSASANEAVKKTDIPILFFHGTGDSFVPVEMGLRNYEACASEKDMVIAEGAEHGFTFLAQKQECLDKIKDFLKKYVGI